MEIKMKRLTKLTYHYKASSLTRIGRRESIVRKFLSWGFVDHMHNYQIIMCSLFMNPLLNLVVLATTSVRATENFCWVFLSVDVVICGVILVTFEAHLELSDWHFRCFISYPGNNSVKTIQPYSHVVQWGFLQQACVSCVFLSFEHFEVKNFLCPSRLTANTGNITRIKTKLTLGSMQKTCFVFC